ncbi:MAG: 1-deoxy-D-xylulose-5-phosphate reductoisomerase [Candidatus Omnitrophica bacterium]|nr:1-deoxy-D-xylulose-5-phosphate reductoisomerase [Candidatus Omnitrophota bacterium]
MRRVAILGSTGSVGKNTLGVIESLGDGFEVFALSTYSDVNSLARQIRQFRPKRACVVNEAAFRKLKKEKGPFSCRICVEEEGLLSIVEDKDVDLVVLAITGSAGLLPLLAAIKKKKIIILANKEALVMAGDLIIEEAKRTKAKILPVDSEQSAIWQCLEGQDKLNLKQIYLTCSGGPFHHLPFEELKQVTRKQVLCHPRWNMGRKITVDSATLMNKGFEIMETMSLFGLSFSQIEVIIHPEAIIHSMVEFIDGVVIALLSRADMRIPIQYALTWPQRRKTYAGGVDFFKLKKLTFEKPDLGRFPCLRLAINVAKERGSLPCVLNAANEVAVDAFLRQRIDFLKIPKIIQRVLGRHKKIGKPSLEDVLACNAWARAEAERCLL